MGVTIRRTPKSWNLSARDELVDDREYGILEGTVREAVLSHPRYIDRIRKAFAATFVVLSGRLAFESR